MNDATISWHQALLPAVDRHVPRLPRSAMTVARTLCDLAAAHKTGKVWAGAYYVAERSAVHNGGRELHPRTVQRALVLLAEFGLIERVTRGGRGKTYARASGGRGIASIYSLGCALSARLRRLFSLSRKGNSRNYGETTVPESRDIHPGSPVQGAEPAGAGRRWWNRAEPTHRAGRKAEERVGELIAGLPSNPVEWAPTADPAPAPGERPDSSGGRSPWPL